MGLGGGMSALVRTFLLELPRSRRQELEGKSLFLTSTS